MVGKSFDVIYDDFSGGHFVGPVGTKQPKNTFVGAGIGVCQTDGTLLPLKAFWDGTGAIAGDTAVNSSRPFLDPISGKILWAGNANVYAITNVGSTPPLTVVSGAIGAAVTPGCLPCAFNASVIFPCTASTNIVSVYGPTMAVSVIGIGITTTMLCAFGNFLMGVGPAATNTVYFSNPGTQATWTIATDFFPVGDPGVVINGMCVHQGSLYIATSVGMWVATGVPGQTLSLRQITTVPFTEPFSIDTSVVRTFGVQGAAVSELAGTNQRALNYGLCPDGRPALLAGAGAGRINTSIGFAYSDIGSITDEGGAVTDLGATMWVLDFYNGQWCRRQVTTAPARMGSGQSTYAHLFYRSGSPDAESLWFAPANAQELVCNNDGTPATGTVELAEYYHPVPFTVKEVVVEADYGSVQTDFTGHSAGAAAAYATGNRSVAVGVKTPGVPIEEGSDLTQARAQSSIGTQLLPSLGATGSNYTRRRSFMRFNPTDGATTYTATPVVTLTGVKLRRLVMRCQEVG